MVQTLELRATQDGVIWPRRPLVSSKGLLSCVKNLLLSSHANRPARFRAVTFNASGDLLAATDERGRVFIFYVTANRYSMAQHLGTGTTHCCFSPTHKTELLVTCQDATVRCLDVQSQLLISTLRGHKRPVRCASFQKSGKLALTASQDAVILWETKDWSRYRVLNAGPGVEEAIFVARGDLVAVCFQDDTIMMWELQSLALKYQFSLPEKDQLPGLQTIAVSDNHQVLVASGRAPFIYVWGFESQTIIRIVELPTPIKQVIRHAFVPGCNTMISILADNGGVFFLDIAATIPEIKLEISNQSHTISTFDIECHARYLAASTSDGFLLLYDMDIARKTAARAEDRRKKEGFVQFEGHARIRARSGLQEIVFPDDVDPTGESNEADMGAPERNRPVPSKLIDSLFGAKGPRQAGRTAKQTRIGATTASYTESSCMPPSFDKLTKKAMSNDSPTLQKKIRNRRTNPLVRPPDQLTAQEIEVNRKRLVSFLKCNGMYPKKYRALVWRFLLRLPKNEETFRSLVAKGKHPAFIRLKDQYPLQNGRTFRRLHRIISAIVYWCPAFGEVSYLPAVVYPFVKMFRENDLAAFEASASVLLHWCGDFLVSLPNPPVTAMSAIEKELAWRDAQLYDHFTQYHVASEAYAWGLLQTIFTEVLSKDEWMCLWDHLFTFSDTPQLLFVAVLAYLSYFRTALLAACDRFSIEQFFHQQNAINIQEFIQLMMNLRDKLNLSDFTPIEDPPTTDSMTRGHGRLWPLSRGQDPTFARYPRVVKDFQISERNRVAVEKEEVAHKYELLEQIEGGSKKLRTEHEKWMKERKLIIDARKATIAAEKERMLHLKTLDYDTRKRRLQHLRNMESSAHETLDEATKMLESEYHRLESILAARKERMELEILSHKQEEDLQRIELQTYNRVDEIYEQHEMEERLSRLRTEVVTRVKFSSLQDKLKFESWKRIDDEQAREAKMQLHRREECALQSQENRVRQESKKDFAMTGRRASHSEQQEFTELNHEANGHNDVYQTARDSTGRPSAQAHEREERNCQHSSRELTHREAATGNSEDSTYRGHRTRDDASDPDMEESRSILANDEMQGNAGEGIIPLPTTLDCAFNKIAIYTPIQGSFSSESSMSFARRTMAEMSLLENVFGNSSSNSSSHNSDISMEGHSYGAVDVDEVSSTYSRDLTVQEEVKSQDQASPTGKWSSPLTALKFSQVKDDAIGIPHIMQPFSQEHAEKAITPQADRQITQVQENGGQFLLRFSAGKVSAPGATPDLSQDDEELSLQNLPPAQEEDEQRYTSQAVGAYAHVNNDEQFTREAITDEDSKAEEPVGVPRVDSKPVDSDAAEQGFAPVDDQTENLNSGSEINANSTALDALQRPIAELEKKLGIRFDDFSDEEEDEDESVDESFDDLEDGNISSDGRAKLMQRAKRLLELSSFDTNSDDDL